MDFSIPTQIEAYRSQIQHFVDDRLIPLENDPASYDEFENIRLDLLAELRQETKAMGIAWWYGSGAVRHRGAVSGNEPIYLWSGVL